jgi:hypothetical protein
MHDRKQPLSLWNFNAMASLQKKKKKKKNREEKRE